MSQKEYIQVWDLLTRIFHSSLIVFVLVAFLSGDEKSSIHLYAGYTVLGLIIARVVWGFIGSKHARFNDFIYPPKEAIQYLKGLIQGSPKYYIGHNPAAGWMVLLLLIIIFVVCGTGRMANQTKGQGLSAHGNNIFPIVNYAHADSDSDSDDDEDKENKKDDEDEFWEEFHEASSHTLLAFILLHMIGTLASSKLHNENLVSAMITGKKEKRAYPDGSI
jgi:cytochrome b